MPEKEGLIFYGKIVKPPYKIRQELSKVYVNDIEVYPLPPVQAAAEASLPSFEPEGEESPKLEFKLDKRTKKALEEGLSLVSSLERFAEKAVKLMEFLKEKQVQAYRDETYGDVMIDTGEGWGVVALFNEEARIKLIKESRDCGEALEQRYPYDDATEFSAHLRTALHKGDLVVLDAGIMSIIPRDEAKQLLLTMKNIAKSDSPHDKKVKRVSSVLSIPLKSAEKVLENLQE